MYLIFNCFCAIVQSYCQIRATISIKLFARSFKNEINRRINKYIYIHFYFIMYVYTFIYIFEKVQIKSCVSSTARWYIITMGYS